MKKSKQSKTSSKRGAHRDALRVFLGDWKAEGESFGGPNQDAGNPRGNPTRWTSTHSAHWHTGKFFLIQDERAQVGGPFDTLSVMGWDDEAGSYIARTFENHGFYRHYTMTVEGNVWSISGKTERARIEFSATVSGKSSLGSGDPKSRGWRCAIVLPRSCDAQRPH